MSHYTFKHMSIHWNELVPGDTFTIVSEHGDLEVGNVLDVWRGSVNLQFELGKVYFVVSRRIGPELPVPRDYYVFLMPGPCLSPEIQL